MADRGGDQLQALAVKARDDAAEADLVAGGEAGRADLSQWARTMLTFIAFEAPTMP